MHLDKTKLVGVTLLTLLALGGYAWFHSQIHTGSPPGMAIRRCRTEMQQIDGAKSMWAADHQKTTNDTPTWADLVGSEKYLRYQPRCGKGGIYALGRVGEKQGCSIPEHNVAQ
jgi:hypothetical protein